MAHGLLNVSDFPQLTNVKWSFPNDLQTNMLCVVINLI